MKCKNCKEKHKPFSSTDNWCKKIDCQTAKAMYLLDKKKKDDEKKAKERKKKENKKFKDMKINSYFKENKKLLQNEVNKLSRKIDAHFGFRCIDCDKIFTGQIDAAHLHNVGGNENIRWNFHNLHSARGHCNQYSSEHKVGYREGIIKRYGEEYLEYIDIEIPKKYSYLGLNAKEVYDFLAVARKLNREFSKHEDNLINGIQARNYFNDLLGIYK